MILILLYFFKLCSCDNPSISTSSGIYIGRYEKTYNGINYMSFKGIKFASVRERFMEAEPVNDGNESHDASQYGPMCSQLDDNSQPVGVEDCLSLNVFIPQLNNSLPVIIYIYGGSFNDGYANLYSPEYFMEAQQVVIVSISYRVGAFGFLYLDDPNFPANLGIRDQILGIRWVKNNAKYFGGDAARITIAGQSAGAASVSILMNSPLAKGLFDGAISESGSSCALWAVQPRCTGLQRLRLLADKLECSFSPSQNKNGTQNLIECLRSKSAKQILEKTNEFQVYYKTVPFPPILEPLSVQNPVITVLPWLNGTKSSVTRWITGVNSEEGSSLVLGSLPNSKLQILGLKEFLPLYLPELLNYRNTAAYPEYITAEILWNDLETYLVDFKQFLVKIISDVDMFYPMVQCLRQNGAPSYGYYFNYISYAERNKTSGISHGGELKYLWLASAKIRVNGSEMDKAISKNLVNTWINFAYNKSLNIMGGEWTRYDAREDNILVIDNSGFRMATNPNKKIDSFYQSINLANSPKTKNCF